MTRLFIMLFVALNIMLQPAQAGLFERNWIDDEIQNTISDVLATKNEVLTGNLAIVKEELFRQWQERRSHGLLLTDSVQDFLSYLKKRQETNEYRSFVGAGGAEDRCGVGSPCHDLRQDLIIFVQDFAATRDMFPVIERLGFGDGSRATRAIEIAPPIILFALHQTMGRTNAWRTLPDDLRDLFDEVGDPEVFSDFLDPFSRDASEASLASQASVGTFGILPKTPTQRFCDNHARRLEREIDPVRLNRLKMFVFWVKSGFKVGQALTHQTIGGTVVGEGSDSLLPNPLKVPIAVPLEVIELIQKAVDTFRANLQICRDQRHELELQVAQCIPLVDFVKPTKRDEVYNLVVDIVNKANDEMVPVDKARKFLEDADNQRNDGKFRQAFQSLCTAYEKIGD